MPSWDDDRRAYPRGERPPRDDERDWMTFESAEDTNPPANWVSIVAVLSMLAVIGIIVFLGLTA